MSVYDLLIRVGLRRPFPPEREIGLESLQNQWSYTPSRPDIVDRALRGLSRVRKGRAPASVALRPIAEAAPRWIAYFLFLPPGRQLDAGHRYTLARLREADAHLLIICAAASPGDVPPELGDIADALYWKDLPGFDFSAYAIAVRAIAAASPGADLLVLNDSVFGPFAPVDSLWSYFQWDLSGFTAAGQVQNHVQSYAFCLKAVTPQRVAALAAVFPEGAAFDDYMGVVMCQETRLAAVAAESMSVGALWFAERAITIDPSLFAALPLLDAGFPFLKRGLLTKHGRVYPAERVMDRLRILGHPTEELAAQR